jgi:hypothetical protein
MYGILYRRGKTLYRRGKTLYRRGKTLYRRGKTLYRRGLGDPKKQKIYYQTKVAFCGFFVRHRTTNHRHFGVAGDNSARAFSARRG